MPCTHLPPLAEKQCAPNLKNTVFIQTYEWEISKNV